MAASRVARDIPVSSPVLGNLVGHGPMRGAEHEIEDRKEGGEVAVEVLGARGVMECDDIAGR